MSKSPIVGLPAYHGLLNPSFLGNVTSLFGRFDLSGCRKVFGEVTVRGGVASSLGAITLVQKANGRYLVRKSY